MKASSTGSIDAFIGAVAVSATFGGENGIGASIGVSVARNFIGWDPSTTPNSTTYTTSDHPTTLSAGNTVAIETGARSGDVYQYLGPTLTTANGPIDLTTQDYSNHDLWKQIGLTRVGAPIQAYIQDSSVDASGLLTISTTSTQSIDAKVMAGSVALAAGGEVGAALSGAGVYTENRIGTDVKSYIDGDGATGIHAGSISVTADDSSGIDAIAGAASIAGSVGGEAGVSVSIGLAIAINEVSNQVFAYIANADTGVSTTSGDLSVSATSHGKPLFDLSSATFTPTTLNDAADKGTLSTLNSLASAFASHGEALPTSNSVNHASNYTTADGTQTIKPDEMVYLNTGYSGGGIAGAVYKYTGTAQSLNLGTQNYANTALWTRVLSFRLTTLSAGKTWSLTSGDGTTYILSFDSVNNVIHVSRSTINVVSAAASVALTFGGEVGIAFSGAGAVAQNEVLTKTDAYIDTSTISRAGTVDVLATSTSGITSSVAAVSIAVGAGGDAGVGASIGVAVAQNFIGYQTDGTKSAAEVMAYATNSSIHSTNALTIKATSSQSIDTIVLSGSAAIGAAGAVGIAVSGSGVYSENEIGVNTKAYIDGDGSSITPGIQSSAINVTAQDTSQISAVAGAASLAAAFAGSTAVAVSVGVALAKNRIDSEIAAYIANADNRAKTTSGAITIEALETASIDVIAAAASLAVGIGGDFGGGVSGAGAEATNIILTGVNAYVSGSILNSAGAVTLNANNSSSIHALIATASVAAGVGTVGVGASIGIALARNDIGWDFTSNQAYDYTSSQTLSGGLTYGKRVKISKGVSAGDVYEYIGPTLTGSIDLKSQDYSDTTKWKQLNLIASGAPVQAYVLNSSITAAGALNLTATSTETIDAIVLSGSVAISGGAGGVGLSGAGAGALNRVSSQIRAYIDGDGATGISASSIHLKADDESTIDVIVGAASIAASFGGVGVSFSLGVGMAFNEISNQVEAAIKNADTGVTTTSGSIKIESIENATITATAAAASAAAAIAGSVAASLSGAGAAALNVILTTNNAHVDSSILNSASDVILNANNTGVIEANVIAASASIAVGGVAGIGASIGAAFAENFIGYTLDGTRTPAQDQAYFSNSSVLATGELSATALSSATITAYINSGSVAVSGGSEAGIGISGAGAFAQNQVATLVTAYIDGDGASGIRSSGVSLNASDTSTISAEAGSASVAAGFGIAGIAVSIGVGTAQNIISNDVESYISNADTQVSTGSDYSTTSGSVSLKPGDRVGLGSGYAVPDYNTVSNGSPDGTRTVTIQPGDFVQLSPDYSTTPDTGSTKDRQLYTGDFVLVSNDFTGSGTKGTIYKYVKVLGQNDPHPFVDLNAQDYTDTSLWMPVSGQANAVYKYVGGAASLDLKSQDFTTANWVKVGGTSGTTYRYIGTAQTLDLTGQDYSNAALWTPTTPGDISISSSEGATIKAISIAASAAIGGGLVGIAISGAGANSTNVILTKTNAYVLSSTLVSGQNVNITATDTADIQALVVGLSGALGVGAVGGAVSIGSSSAQNYIGYKLDGFEQDAQVEAYVQYSSIVAVGSITQTATSNATITANVDAGSVALAGGGVAVAASGAGADVINKIATDVKAFTTNSQGAGIHAGHDITLSATDTSSISAVVVAVSIAGSIGAYGGSAAVGLSLASNQIGNDVEAYISNASVTTDTGNLNVYATENATLSAISAAAAVAFNVSIGASLSGGGAEADATITTTTQAYVQNSTLNLGGDLNVQSQNNSTATSDVLAVAASFSIIAIAVSGSVVQGTITPTSRAFVTNSNVVANAINIIATVTPSLTLTAGGFSVSTGASVGVSSATATVSPIVSASVGGAGNTITAQSLNVTARQLLPNSGDSVHATAFGSAGGLLVGIDATYSNVSNASSVTSSVADGTTLDIAGGTTILATNENRQYANSSSASIGLVAAGITTAIASSNSTTRASLGNDVKLTGATLNVTATGHDNNYAETTAGAGGVVSGAAASSTTNNTSHTSATIGNASAGRNIDLSTRGAGRLTLAAEHTATFNSREITTALGFLSGSGAYVTQQCRRHRQCGGR